MSKSLTTSKTGSRLFFLVAVGVSSLAARSTPGQMAYLDPIPQVPVGPKSFSFDIRGNHVDSPVEALWIKERMANGCRLLGVRVPQNPLHRHVGDPDLLRDGPPVTFVVFLPSARITLTFERA